VATTAAAMVYLQSVMLNFSPKISLAPVEASRPCMEKRREEKILRTNGAYARDVYICVQEYSA
jgi:hypothetical protein